MHIVQLNMYSGKNGDLKAPFLWARGEPPMPFGMGQRGAQFVTQTEYNVWSEEIERTYLTGAS